MGILAIEGRVGVGTSGHHQAVEPADHVDRIGVASQLHRQPTDRGDALRVLAEMEVDLLALQRALRQVRHALHRPAPPGQPDQWSSTHAGVNAIGSRLIPLMKLERKRSTGPSNRAALIVGSSSSKRTLSSIRASWAPRHRCGLMRPNATCSLGVRWMSKW